MLEPLWRLGVLRRAAACGTLESRLLTRTAGSGPAGVRGWRSYCCGAGVARFAAELLRSLCDAASAARNRGGDADAKDVAPAGVRDTLLSKGGCSVAGLLDGAYTQRAT